MNDNYDYFLPNLDYYDSVLTGYLDNNFDFKYLNDAYKESKLLYEKRLHK